MTGAHQELLEQILMLNELIWEHRLDNAKIENWLSNFADAGRNVAEERRHALYLLSRFLYYGDGEIRALLKALFRDLYKYPIVESVRRRLGNSLDFSRIDAEFKRELAATRFLGIGNPSESGSHLLYYFRQENRLDKDLFISTHQIFEPHRGTQPTKLRDIAVTRYIFVDDFAGSGQQADEYSRDLIEDMLAAASSSGLTISVCYYPLVATSAAIGNIRSTTKFTDVRAVIELDDSFKAFDPSSRYFRAAPATIDRALAESMCRHYGTRLWAAYPVGYRDCQLLLGFHHNTPDNSLPIIWFDEHQTTWKPIFRRYPKL